DCHHQTLDMGQFGYVRPCATVTGCCHMFRTERLLAQGGFDLRYSPTQYDDLDHDVRLLLAGLTPVYQGRLRVRHFKSTGSQGGVGQAQWGLGWANQYKLHQKFEAEDFRRAAATAQKAALEDLRARREMLEQAP
ncbi:MAG: glycosyltransferase family 2 protein, partial [Acidobacteriota bacterium]